MSYNSFDLITDTLYIGDENAVKNNASNFDLIINTSNSVKCPSAPECMFFPIANSEGDVLKYFNLIKTTGVIEKIRSFIQNKKKVLINCTQGMHRSCTMAACYYMKYNNMNVDQVMKFLKSKRKVAFNPVYRLRGVLDLYFKSLRPQAKAEHQAKTQQRPQSKQINQNKNLLDKLKQIEKKSISEAKNFTQEIVKKRSSCGCGH